MATKTKAAAKPRTMRVWVVMQKPTEEDDWETLEVFETVVAANWFVLNTRVRAKAIQAFPATVQLPSKGKAKR